MVQKTGSYKAYLKATGTVAKTQQVVMLYDGAIRFLKQAVIAIQEKRIEERYNLLSKASEIMIGLQSSIDFENGGNIAYTLHGFYTQMTQRMLSTNFVKDPQAGEKQCDGIIADLKQMRDVWESIDQGFAAKAKESAHADSAPAPTGKPASGIVISA